MISFVIYCAFCGRKHNKKWWNHTQWQKTPLLSNKKPLQDYLIVYDAGFSLDHHHKTVQKVIS